MNKQIYLLLSRTGTLFSRAIHSITGNQYTHVSISFDPELDHMYSFARQHPHLPFIAGFVTENIRTGVFGKYPDAPCTLYSLTVTAEAYEHMKAMVAKFEEAPELYRYSMLGILLIQMDLPLHRERHFVCSQFVAQLLEKSGALALPKDSALMTPNDFIAIPALRQVFTGTLRQYPGYQNQTACC